MRTTRILSLSLPPDLVREAEPVAQPSNAMARDGRGEQE